MLFSKYIRKFISGVDVRNKWNSAVQQKEWSKCVLALILNKQRQQFILFSLAYRSYSYWTVQAKVPIYSCCDDTWRAHSHTEDDHFRCCCWRNTISVVWTVLFFVIRKLISWNQGNMVIRGNFYELKSKDIWHHITVISCSPKDIQQGEKMCWPRAIEQHV